ncbi:MAG: hypothetical protein ABSC42_12140 [Tepidisphaeraceae bacterium]|jgi:hypothetical protein
MTNDELQKPDAPEPDQDWQNAVQRRLTKLRNMPVELAALEARVNAAIPPQRRSVIARMTTWRIAEAIAAGFILVVVSLGLMFIFSGGPVVASAQDFAQFHEDLVAGRVQAVHVTTIEAANKALAAQDSLSPQLPEVPNEHVMACCMNSVKGKRVACVLIDQGGTPVTLTVANAADMKSPASPMVEQNGSAYHVHAVNGLNMVMTERHGRWICLMGRLPRQRLMDLADQLQF